MNLNRSAKLICRGVAFLCLMTQGAWVPANAAPGKKPQPAVDPAALAAANQPQLLHAGTDPAFRAPVLRASGWTTGSISFGWLEITRERVRYEVVQPKSKMNEGLDLPRSSISGTQLTGDGVNQTYVNFVGGDGKKANVFAYVSPDRWRPVHYADALGILLKYSGLGTQALALALSNFDAALDKALAQPFRDGDHNKVQALLKDNPDLLLAKDGKGMTPLHWAAEGGHLDMVEYVLAGKLDVNIRDKNNNTPLDEAARVGHREVAELLLARGALVDAPNGEGATPLMMAAQNGRTEIVDLLLAKRANVNSRTNGAVTPLLAASEAGHRDVVRLLLASHADVNAGDADGATPLIRAARHSGRMITASVPVPATRPGALTGERDTSRRLQPDYQGIVDLLLASGADVNASTREGQTALTSAAALGEAPIVQALLAKGANANARQSNGETALLLAVQSMDRAVERPAPTSGWSGSTYTMSAAAGQVERPASAALPGKVMRSPIAPPGKPLSSANDYPKIVDVLLSSGADANAKANDGVTALMLASGSGPREVVESLLAKGAEINAQSNDGNTALSFAVRGNTREVVELLLAKGAGTHTLYDPVLVPGSPGLIKFLETHGNDYMLFTSREHPISSLSEIRSDSQFGAWGPGTMPGESVQDMFALKQIVTGNPDSLLMIGNGHFNALFSYDPQLKLFMTFRGTPGLSSIESQGGGRLVFFVNSAVPGSPK